MIKNTPDIKTTPKRLILSLLSSPGFKEINVMDLIGWGKVFNIDPAATRVAVGRLAKQGLISSVARGKYTIGPNAEVMANTARSWINAESKVGAWSGRWLVAHTAHLGRANKTAVRSREGSFRLSGFAALVPDLWCRPANLKESLQQTKDRLVSIGLERQAVLMSSDEISGIEIEALFQLWPIAKIESGYSQAIETMDQSRAKLGSMDVIDAARETFLVGESVIRQINADPLLPDEMIDSKCRRQMISEMKQYNELGWIVWEEFQLSLQS